MKSTIYEHPPAPVLGLPTVTYCTENEGTPGRSDSSEGTAARRKR